MGPVKVMALSAERWSIIGDRWRKYWRWKKKKQ